MQVPTMTAPKLQTAAAPSHQKRLDASMDDVTVLFAVDGNVQTTSRLTFCSTCPKPGLPDVETCARSCSAAMCDANFFMIRFICSAIR